jgi:type II secretory pathway component PulF
VEHLGFAGVSLTVFAIAVVLLTFLLLLIVPQFEMMFNEFQLQLPMFTETLLFASRSTVSLVHGPAKWMLVILFISFLIAMYLSGTGRGGATIQRVLTMMPILGPLWVWSGASSFTRLLATLLEHDIPLPEALLLTGDGMDNAELRRAGTWLSQQVQSGQTLSQLVESSGCLPASAVPVLRWGEQSGVSRRGRTDPFRNVCRPRLSADCRLRSALPPVIYLFVVLSIGFAITSLFMPLVTLIQGLS